MFFVDLKIKNTSYISCPSENKSTVKMLLASVSNSQTIAPSSSVKLRRSRRLSSTRGLKQRTTASVPKDSFPYRDLDRKFENLCPVADKSIDEDNARGGLLINWEMNERISLSSRSSTGLTIRPDGRRGIEFSETRRRNVEDRSKVGPECTEREAKSTRPTLELMNVSGFPGSNVERKHRGACWTDMTDENILRSDSKYEIGILSRDSATWRKQRRQGDTLAKDNGDATKKWTKDSISKRLELIHELNQKILANYERFQQRSRRTKDAKAQTVKSRVKDKTDAEEHVYTEIKKRHRTGGCRTSDRKARDTLKHDICGRESSKKDASRQPDSDKSTFSKDYERIDSKGRTEKERFDRKIVRENTNFSLAAKENFSPRVDEKTQLSKYPKSKDRKEQLSVESWIFYASENIPSKETSSVATEDCLENSKLYPESYNPRNNNETKNDSLTEKTEDDASRNRSEIDSPRDAAMDEKILECKILEKLDETIDRFDSEKTRLSSGDSNEEGDSFSTDSIQSPSPRSKEKCTKDAASLLQDTFNSSWDSGVGVADVGNGSGWVRIHTGIESSLVYLTLDTTARDVCRDMLLGDDLSLFVQVNANFKCD